MNLCKAKEEVSSIEELMEKSRKSKLEKVIISPYIVEMEERYWLPCLRIETEKYLYQRMVTKKFLKEEVSEVEEYMEKLAKSLGNYFLKNNFLVVQRPLKYKNKAPKRMKDEEADFYILSPFLNNSKNSQESNAEERK